MTKASNRTKQILAKFETYGKKKRTGGYERFVFQHRSSRNFKRKTVTEKVNYVLIRIISVSILSTLQPAF